MCAVKCDQLLSIGYYCDDNNKNHNDLGCLGSARYMSTRKKNSIFRFNGSLFLAPITYQLIVLKAAISC